LTKDDLWDIEHSETSQVLSARLEKQWKIVAKKYLKELKISPSESPVKGFKLEHAIKEKDIILNPQTHKLKSAQIKLKKPSLLLCIIKAFGGKFFAGSLLILMNDTIIFFRPIILG
jgi:hypothetical protein